MRTEGKHGIPHHFLPLPIAHYSVLMPLMVIPFQQTSGVYTVTGTGTASGRSRTVNATLRLFSPFDYAIFTRGLLELKSSTTVNWYNNQADDWPLQVGTTSTADGAISI